MSLYVVIDTNILVSALLSGSEEAATVQLTARMLRGEIIPVYSNAIMAEYRAVLGRKKFGFSADTVNYLLSAIARFGSMIEPSPSGAILPDMKDLPFYDAVRDMQEPGAYLVTGNLRHFPHEPFIVTARQLLELMDAPERP